LLILIAKLLIIVTAIVSNRSIIAVIIHNLARNYW